MLNSAVRRGVIAYPTRPPTLPPDFAVTPRPSGASRAVMDWFWRRPDGSALNSWVPSPRYQDDTRRLGNPVNVVNADPGAGSVAVPSEERKPNSPPPWTSTSHLWPAAPVWAKAGDAIIDVMNVV